MMCISAFLEQSPFQVAAYYVPKDVLTQTHRAVIDELKFTAFNFDKNAAFCRRCLTRGSGLSVVGPVHASRGLLLPVILLAVLAYLS